MINKSKKTALYCAAYCTMAMAAIVYFGAGKSIEISDVGQDEVYIEKTVDSVGQTTDSNDVHFVNEDSETEFLAIPLPPGTDPQSVTIENHYMESELHISLKIEDSTFYKTHALWGNRTNVTAGHYEELEDGVELVLLIDGIFEYRTVLEDDTLYVSFNNPKEIYDRIVVIDPLRGGADNGVVSGELYEKDIALTVAKKLKDKLDASDIKAYYTRMDDVNPTEEARVNLPNKVKADMYIRLSLDYFSDSSVYGITCIYNDEYFIPGFGNVELSDAVEKNVVTAVKGKALGLKSTEKTDYALIHSQVPSVTLKMGCLSNHQEAILLGKDDYTEKLAQGIYDAIVSVYDDKE